MNPQIFQDALKEAEEELDQVLAEEAAIEERRVELEIRAAKLTENIGHLAALAAPSVPGFRARLQRAGLDSGMTSAILQVLRAAEEPLPVSEIKTRIEKYGFTPDKYKNILATLHIALDRVSKKDGQVIKLRDARGKKVYQPNPNYSPIKLNFNSKRIREALNVAIQGTADTPLPLRKAAKHKPKMNLEDAISGRSGPPTREEFTRKLRELGPPKRK